MNIVIFPFFQPMGGDYGAGDESGLATAEIQPGTSSATFGIAVPANGMVDYPFMS